MPDFSLERQILDTFQKPSNRHGNNGGRSHSGRPKTRWKEVKIVQNVSKETA